MTLFNVLLLNLGLTMAIMLVLWLISLPIRNSSIVDIFWGVGFVVIAWSTYFFAETSSWRSILVVGLTTLWGLRLAGYLAWRNLGKGEDERYQEMREKYGSRFPWISLFLVFWLQGLIMWVVAFPLQAAQFEAAPLYWLDAIGVAVWSVGWLWESVGDWQLARFKADPQNQGKVMDRGLWRYSRHPNYFGDFLVWWGLFLIAAAAGAWWTVVSPLLMSFLLLRVSGVTLLERSLRQKRPEYQDYIRRTSAFFPWPPKQTSQA